YDHLALEHAEVDHLALDVLRLDPENRLPGGEPRFGIAPVALRGARNLGEAVRVIGKGAADPKLEIAQRRSSMSSLGRAHRPYARALRGTMGTPESHGRSAAFGLLGRALEHGAQPRMATVRERDRLPARILDAKRPFF